MAKFKAKKRSDYKAPDFTAVSAELTFDLSDEKTKVSSLVRYRRLTSDKKAPLILDGEELKLLSVALDGGSCKYQEGTAGLVIEDVPDDFELAIENVISPVTNSELMGLYKSDGCFCTQCEPEGFRRITYFLDRPDVLCRYRVTIIGPEYGYGVLLSNGNLIEKGVKKGRNYAVWDDPFPKPSYLFALVAGTFDIVRDSYKTKSGRNVSLQLYVDRGSYERGLWAMQSIKDSMKWDEDRFNLEYDLDNFKVVAVDFFNQGAMENKSLNIFNSVYVMVDPNLASDVDFYDVQSVIGHEYFHNYTGDRVTLRDWFQLSLKESLTVFRDQEFSADTASRTMSRLNAVSVIRGPQFDEDSSPVAHSVRPDEVSEMNNFYTVTIYDKGAEVIRMIHTLIGEDKFKIGLADYLKIYDGKAATVDDFIACMERAGGISLEQFMRWYTQAGTPKVHAKWSANDQEGTFTISLSQETAVSRAQKVKEPFVIPMRLSFLDPNGHKVELKLISKPEDSTDEHESVPDTLAEPSSKDELLVLKDVSQSFIFTLGQKDASQNTAADIANETEETKAQYLSKMQDKELSGQDLDAQHKEDEASLVNKTQLDKSQVQSYWGDGGQIKLSTLLPVLHEDFSAPVKLDAPYTDDNLALILRNSSDPFIKSYASFELQKRYVHDNMSKDKCAEPEALINALSGVIATIGPKSDLILVSKILGIESLNSLMQTFEGRLNLDKLIAVRRALSEKLSLALESGFKKLYETVRAQSPKYSVADMGRRMVNNQALFMSALAQKLKDHADEASNLVLSHYKNARCMTDRLAAMRTAADLELECQNEIFNSFEKEFGSESLVMDSYFRIRAAVSSEETVFTVRKLLKHPRFDITNPNRVRALVGTLARSNPEALHRKDGAGYHLLGALIRRFNDSNAMLAASLVTPLLQFKRFDEERAALMQEELEKLSHIANISRGLSEKIEAALK